jgi:hypothetical protein
MRYITHKSSFHSTIIYVSLFLLVIKVALQYLVDTGKEEITRFMELLFISKNDFMKARLMELMAAVAVYSELGHKYVNN